MYTQPFQKREQYSALGGRRATTRRVTQTQRSGRQRVERTDELDLDSNRLTGYDAFSARVFTGTGANR